MSKLGTITEKEYNEIKAVRNSELGNIEKSWMHYKMGTTRTDAMIFGSAFHQYILEEPTFWENFVVAPDYDGRTIEGKKIKAELEIAAADGKDIIRYADFDTIKGMKAAILEHPMAKNILHRSENEGAYTANLEGVKCKSKLDLENKGHFFDIKTTDDASPEGFKKSIGKYNYHRQAAFYGDIAASNGVPFLSFNFVAIEKKPPYLIGVYTLCDASIDIGRKSYKRILKKFKLHTDNPGTYEGYSATFQSISAPDWKFFQEATEVQDA